MPPSDPRERFALLGMGVVILLGPVLILAITLEVLILFGDLRLEQVTPVKFLELYIIDLVLFTGLAYGIYRLTLWLVEHRLPKSLDALGPQDAAKSREDESEQTKELGEEL